MRKLLSGGLVVFAGVVCGPVAMSRHQEHATKAPDYRQDPRLEALRNFFDKSECPAAQYSKVFLEAADNYHLDWRLLPSISYVESTGGKASRYNNIFGWDSGNAHFPTPSAGIHEVGYRLTHSSLYKNKKLDKLLATYNPNAEYGQKVKSVMRRIAPTE